MTCISFLTLALLFLTKNSHAQCLSNWEDGENCSSSPNCCATGSCYRKNQWWASCLTQCTPGWIDGYDNYPWECQLLSSSVECYSTWSNEEDCSSAPDCCEQGSCYQKNQWWASCLTQCAPGWLDTYDNYPWECTLLSTSQPSIATQPISANPTTMNPITYPITSQPVTMEPTTPYPTTSQPTTAEPTTAEPITAEPTTAEPTYAPTLQPTSALPTSFPTIPEPNRGDDQSSCPQIWSPGNDCSSFPDCCPSLESCFRKNQWWAGCREECSPGFVDDYDSSTWECILLSSDSRPITEAPTQACSSIWDLSEDCALSPNCCLPGYSCFRKNQWWSQCMNQCTPGFVDDYDDYPWECGLLGTNNSPMLSCETLANSNPNPLNRTGFVDIHGKLRLSGVQLVNEYDEPVQLTGMSSHGLHFFPECVTRDSIQYLVEQWGISVFRAAMYIGEGGYATDPEFNQALVQDIVQWCEELGIYVIIDWHVLTPGDPNAWLTPAINFWTNIAGMFKDKDHVIYEIANEPNGVSWDDVLLYSNTVISAIRNIDPETIICVGTTTYSQDIHLAAAKQVELKYNVMYSFHFYAGSHESLYDRVLQTAQQIPIFATEWGTSEASGENGPFLDVAKRFVDLFSGITGEIGSVTISWAQWSFSDKNETSAALEPSTCAAGLWDRTSCSGTFLKNELSGN